MSPSRGGFATQRRETERLSELLLFVTHSPSSGGIAAHAVENRSASPALLSASQTEVLASAAQAASIDGVTVGLPQRVLLMLRGQPNLLVPIVPLLRNQVHCSDLPAQPQALSQSTAAAAAHCFCQSAGYSPIPLSSPASPQA